MGMADAACRLSTPCINRAVRMAATGRWPNQMIGLYPDEVEACKAMPLRTLVAYTLMTREEDPSLNHAFVVAALYLKLQTCSISTLRRVARRIRGTA